MRTTRGVRFPVELVSCQPFDDFPQTNWIALKYGRAAEQAEKQEEYLCFPGLPSALLFGPYIGGADCLNFKGRSHNMNRTYLRGDMYYADLGRGVGSEQEGYRPVLIIQNNTGNKYSPPTICSKRKMVWSFLLSSFWSSFAPLTSVVWGTTSAGWTNITSGGSTAPWQSALG